MVKLIIFNIGVAYHCYGVSNAMMSRLDSVHKTHPNLFLLMTECCQGFRKITNPLTPARLGDWGSGQDYAQNIMHVSSPCTII